MKTRVFLYLLGLLVVLVNVDLWALDGRMFVYDTPTESELSDLVETNDVELYVDPILSEDQMRSFKKNLVQNIEKHVKNNIEIKRVKRPLLPQNDGVNDGNPVAYANEVYTIIVWNGLKDENGRELVLTESKEIPRGNLNGGESDVILGVTPLSGKTISLKRSDREFQQLQNLLEQKESKLYRTGVTVPQTKDETLPLRADFCAFELEWNESSDLVASIEQKLRGFFEGQNPSIKLSSSDKDVLDKYLERGFRNFVFNVFDYDYSDRYGFIKAPLAMEFQTDRIFLPFDIAKIGSCDDIFVDLLILTPEDFGFDGKIWTSKIFQEKEGWDIDFYQGKSLSFAIGELNKESVVADFCKKNGLESFKMTETYLSFNIDDVNGDLATVWEEEFETLSDLGDSDETLSDDDVNETSSDSIKDDGDGEASGLPMNDKDLERTDEVNQESSNVVEGAKATEERKVRIEAKNEKVQTTPKK